ncbi:DUF2171 domain-containing protein [Bradyrhizobium sp. WBOS07]|nr:DUF2171 domain-containing protein [Bradyrhizobium sp. WBOS07]
MQNIAEHMEVIGADGVHVGTFPASPWPASACSAAMARPSRSACD